jgi:hypothetical protein
LDDVVLAHLGVGAHLAGRAVAATAPIPESTAPAALPAVAVVVAVGLAA